MYQELCLQDTVILAPAADTHDYGSFSASNELYIFLQQYC
jgi:hypothetical protein